MTSGLHPRRGIAGDDLRPGLAQPARDVPAAGRDVERGHARARLAELDDDVEIGVRRMCVDDVRYASARSLQTSLMPRAPPPVVLHRASSARRAGSAGRRRRGSAGPPRRSSRRAARRSAPRSSSRSSASRIPRATSSQRVIPPKMLKKIERTCGSRVITSSASTTPSALPPPPRSQKFAGLPPATTTTSTVDIARPGAVAEDPDGAVELHVDDALLPRERLERIGRASCRGTRRCRDGGRARCRRR